MPKNTCLCVLSHVIPGHSLGVVTPSALESPQTTLWPDRVVWWSVLHLIKTPPNHTFSARAYLAWRGSEEHAGVFWRGFLRLQRRENLRVGVLKKERKKKRTRSPFSPQFLFFPLYCCWAALQPLLWRRNRQILLAERWGRPAGVGDAGIGWFVADRTRLEGKQEEDGGVVAERSEAGVTLPSHWVTMAPWGECWGCRRGCVCVHTKQE